MLLNYELFKVAPGRYRIQRFNPGVGLAAISFEVENLPLPFLINAGNTMFPIGDDDELNAFCMGLRCANILTRD